VNETCGCGHKRQAHHGRECVGFNCDCRWFYPAGPWPEKMSTAEFRSRLLPLPAEYSMCWGSVFNAFGVAYELKPGKSLPLFMIMKSIREAGWITDRVDLSTLVPLDHRYECTLAVLLPKITSGNWVISVAGHVLCIRDGKITDTMGWDQTVKRHVRSLYQVSSNPQD